jgi:peptidoglycan/xylan/chitin deacetylase (PgdA/CDA1 family)
MRFILILRVFLFLFSLLFIVCVHSQDETRNIALTIDDLPFVGEEKNFHLNMIIDTIKAHEVPATGFVIAGNVHKENWAVLQKFKDAGLGIGNHTLSHVNVRTLSAEAYIQQIENADKILTPWLTEPKFFRYPYLAQGEGVKKENIKDYLLHKNYHIAPITIDSKDFIFNQLLLSVPESERRHFLTVLKPCYLDFIWRQTLKAEQSNRVNKNGEQTHILLIHSNLLNAYVLPDILELYSKQGYRFISLVDALKPALSTKSIA